MPHQWAGAVLVFTGIFLDGAFGKQKSKPSVETQKIEIATDKRKSNTDWFPFQSLAMNGVKWHFMFNDNFAAAFLNVQSF